MLLCRAPAKCIEGRRTLVRRDSPLVGTALLDMQYLFWLRFCVPRNCGHFVANTAVNSRYSLAFHCAKNRPCASLSESELI